MLRKIVLAVGLLLNCAGMILTLIVLEALGAFFSGDWPPANWAYLLGNMSASDFLGLLTIPTGALVVSGFLLLAVGILYPKQSGEPVSESQRTLFP
jgi:hypothetical protein